MDLQKSRAWVPYLQNPVYGPITLVLSSEIKECTHGNLHFEHDELLAFYRRFFPPFFQSFKLLTFFLQTFKVQKVWVQANCKLIEILHNLSYICINYVGRYVKHFFQKTASITFLKMIQLWLLGEQTDKCRIDIRKLVGDRSWRWLATLPKWRFCVSQWVEILYKITFLTARGNS